MKLKDRVALITGAGTGMGRAIAELFAREGARVGVNYSRSREAAEEVVAEIRAAGGEAIAIEANVVNEAEALRMVEQVEREFGKLDLLVNNAGWSTQVPHANLDGISDEIWDRTLDVNLRGMFYTTRSAVPLLKKQEGASIINIASVGAFTGLGSSMIYAASKGAVITMTKSLARALAPQIRVNGIAPGLVHTRFANWPEEAFTMAASVTPLGRLATVDDIAKTALFLADSTSITGETIVVDGGLVQLGKR